MFGLTRRTRRTPGRRATDLLPGDLVPFLQLGFLLGVVVAWWILRSTD